MPPEPKREVACADAIPWMLARGRIEGACAVTSLPDVAEVGTSLAKWRPWFLDAVRRVIDAVPDESAALFFQSDIKRDGSWIDKGALVTRAAEDAGARILFHKIVCRRPAGMLTAGGGGALAGGLTPSRLNPILGFCTGGQAKVRPRAEKSGRAGLELGLSLG